ncbi:MAG: hypothetical protein WD314_15745 [Trueperaceae bacterium]
MRPEPLIALLVFAVSAAFFLLGRGEQHPPPPAIEIVDPEPEALETREVRLMRYDASGLEAPVFARVALPDAAPGRLEAILDALRREMADGEWPEALPTPTVYVESLARQSVAILDFRPAGPVPLSVAGELRLLRSVQETLLANGVDQIRFLLHGEAAGVFLEHLAVPAAL